MSKRLSTRLAPFSLAAGVLLLGTAFVRLEGLWRWAAFAVGLLLLAAAAWGYFADRHGPTTTRAFAIGNHKNSVFEDNVSTGTDAFQVGDTEGTRFTGNKQHRHPPKGDQ